ncbi:LysM-like peptidoglycan-binding domain-containing protein [Vibrio hepatarius]|uniref:LysM-like peptidoglycan-binding domain-containing protein n=1 Tax=Vibrio hepatarius TaxID=171383 RepID=UPI001C083AB4|nr:LysM-like peptidoglycan-binding domain-containing protein [Vibrio hepatarius]MBU2895262.1 lysine transporter LysM [Vibrio hepatarius]
MNRRKKKPKQVDYIELAQQKILQVDWKVKVGCIKELWLALPKLHQRALMVLVPVVFILFVIPTSESPSMSESVNEVSSAKQRVQVNINTTGLSEQYSQQQKGVKSETWQEYTVEKGDTLAQVFRNNDLAMADLNALVRVEGNDKPLSQIKAGQRVRFKLAEDGKLDILQLEKRSKSVMFFRLSDGGFGRSK